VCTGDRPVKSGLSGVIAQILRRQEVSGATLAAAEPGERELPGEA
jgi:hypothetical protein